MIVNTSFISKLTTFLKMIIIMLKRLVIKVNMLFGYF